jgi:uncharacterized protein (TIGR02996 family)
MQIGIKKNGYRGARSATVTHEEAFLQEILEHWDDDTPRRIYADYLLDRGDAAGASRGEFIHIQCELARLPGTARPPHLVEREKQLLEIHRREWASPLQRLGCRSWEYRRGFVEGVGICAAEFLTGAATLFRSAPIRTIRLYEAGPFVVELASCPHLVRIATLDLEANGLTDAEAQALASSPYLTGLTALLLWSNRIGDEGVRDLVLRADLPELQKLDLSDNLLGDGAAAALTASPLLERLSLLDLHGNQIGNAGALALVGATTPNLTWLDLGKNPIGPEAGAALRERFPCRVHVSG